jgi:hypothetical protein
MKFILLAAIAMAGGIQLNAQQVASATPFYRPGDTIRVAIEFNGPDVEDLAWLRVRFNRTSGEKDNQRNFIGTIDGDAKPGSEPKNWTAEIKVPDLASDGDYRLELIWARFKTANRPEITYSVGPSGALPDLRVQIKNQKHFENPKIKSLTLLP